MKHKILICISVFAILLSCILTSGCDEGKRKSMKPINVTLSNYTLSWNFETLETIVSFPKVTVTCEGVEGECNSSANGKSVDIRQFIKDSGKYKFTLISNSAWLDDVLYEASDPVEVTFDLTVLASPISLKYNQATGIVDWTPVSGVENYVVKINDEEGVVVNEPKIVLPSQSGVNNVVVYSKGDGQHILDSIDSKMLKINFLNAPEITKVENGIVYWNTIEGAAKYYVRVDGNMVGTAIKGEFKLKNIFTESKIQVMAVGNNNDSYDSAWSEEYIYCP